MTDFSFWSPTYIAFGTSAVASGLIDRIKAIYRLCI